MRAKPVDVCMYHDALKEQNQRISLVNLGVQILEDMHKRGTM